MKITPGRSIRSAATGSLVMPGMLVLWALSSLPALGQSRSSGETTDSEPYPVLVTTDTRTNHQALADLERPGKVIFSDGFESSASLKNYFEIRGLKDGRAKLVADAGVGPLRYRGSPIHCPGQRRQIVRRRGQLLVRPQRL
jgi:hypothetical protein